MPKTRKRTEIVLVGHVTPEIYGNQLPSKKQVLQCYFYYTKHSKPNLTSREALKCVVKKCAMFWEYAEIPMIHEAHAIAKLDKLVSEYKLIRKPGKLIDKYENYQEKEEAFKCTLNNLFDISHKTNVSVMRNEAAKTLLSLHQEEGRNGYLDAIIDTGTYIAHAPQEIQATGKAESLQTAQSGEIAMNYSNYVLDDEEDLNEILKLIMDGDDDDEEKDGNYEPKSASKKPKKLKIITPNITAILDRAKISDRMAARVLAAILIEAKITLDQVHLSRETVRRNRRINRDSLKELIRENAKTRIAHILSVHWDGKLLPSMEDKNIKVDRLPVLVSGHEWHQLLGVPRLDSGTGEQQANAVYALLKEWDVIDDVCAMVFDTTASNTGSDKGACKLLEDRLGRDLLYLACRHHVFEILLKAAFDTSMGGTSGPDVPIFKRFIGEWKNMKKGEFSPGVHEVAVEKAVHGDSANIIAFAETQLKDKTIRNDYREFLELVIMFMGGNLSGGNRFRVLGAIHHARWMAKAIYSLKIFLFREQFRLSPTERKGLMHTCLFIVLAYQQAWFTAPNSVEAPNNDLKLLKQLAANADSSSPVLPSTLWKAVLHKFTGHLWYLSEELIAFAFFDVNVSADCKRRMCQAIKSRPALNDDRKRRKTGMEDLSLIGELSLDSFVTKNTIKFFEILRLDYSFLDTDPITWESRDDFSAASTMVGSLRVTNDIAERSVALVSEYNDLLTKDEGSKQDLMLVVDKLRQLSPGCNKKDLDFSLEKYLNNQSAETLASID